MAVVALAVAAGGLPADDLGTVNAVQWSPFVEWTVENPAWEGNRFEVRAAVTFTHGESGETRRTGMFVAAEKRWCFRFCATRVGEWSFETSSEDEDLDGHRGTVTVAPNPKPGAHGFLKSINGKWGWEGAEDVFVPQLVMWDYIAGGNSPKIFHERPEMVDDRIAQFVGGHGFNGFHLPVVGGRWFDLDAASDEVQAGMTEPDPRTFEALELLITRTHAAGGMVHLWPWGDHARSQTPKSLRGGIGGEIDRRLQRYIAARLGPVPGWSMGYGFDLDEWVRAEQVRAWRDAMHGTMGWRHFLGGRPEGPNHGTDHASDARWNEGLDYGSYEHHRPTYEVYRSAVAATPGRPVMSEDRFRVREGQYPEKDYSPERTRRGLYHSTMAGGVANIWGTDPALSEGGVFPNREQIKTYAIFFHERGRFLADMEPANELSGDEETRVLRSAATGSLVLYRESARTIEIDLTSSSGARPAVAVDTTNPYAEIDLGELQPKKHVLELPDESDWVVAVGTFEPAE